MHVNLCCTATLEDSEEENSGSGYVINTLDCIDDSVYLERKGTIVASQ